MIAGLAAASTSSPTAIGSGAFGGLAQACALVALTAALMPAVARRATESAARQAAEPATCRATEPAGPGGDAA
jgi:hypothetical protein